MSTQPTIENLLTDIVFWSDRARRHIEGMDFESFASDVRTQDAVMRCLEVIGEAAGQILRLYPEFQTRRPEFEFRQAYRARNRTAHGYGSVSIETVWASASVAAPRMAMMARSILHA